MNLNEYRKWCFHTRTSSNLTNELDTLNAIAEFEKGNHSNIIQSEQFKSLLVDIQNSNDMNGFDDEAIGRRLNIDDYNLQRLFRDIAFYIVGKSDSKSDIDLDWLSEKEDAMGHAYYLGLDFSRDCLEGLVEEVKLNTVLKTARNMADREYDNIGKWCKQNIKDDLRPEEIIRMIDIYNDGASTELGYDVDTLAYLLLRNGQWDLWIELLYKLKFFPLQGSMLYGLKTLAEIKHVMEMIAKKDDKCTPVLLWLLRERLYSVSADERLNLTGNLDNESLSESDKSILYEELKLFESSFDDTINQCFDMFIKTFPATDNLNWYAQKEAMSEGKSQTYREADVRTLAIIDNLLTKCIDHTHLDYKELSTQALVYGSELMEAQDAGQDKCIEYIKVLCDKLYGDQSFMTPSLTNKNLGRMRCVYSCLDKSGLDGIALAAGFRPQEREDNEAFYKRIFQCQRGDSYWLSVLMLKAENKEDVGTLKNVSDFIYSMPTDDLQHSNDSYFLPIYIGEMVATQVIKTYKDEYESRLLNSDFALTLKLRVLTANGGELSCENRGMLIELIDAKWADDSRFINKYDKRLYQYLNEYIERVKKNEVKG